MKSKQFIAVITLLYVGSVIGQDSTVPDSVRAMIERSQAGTQFEQMARMQISVQYGTLLESLSGGEARKNRIEAKLIDCLLYTSPSPRDATLSRMPSSA